MLDASAAVEVLLRKRAAARVEQRLLGQTLHAPHLIDVEVTQVLRRYALVKEIDSDRGRTALDDLASLRITRYPHGPLMSRIWELRSNLTAYDAAYVALAEALNAQLVTLDRRLATAAGHHARVEVV